MPKTSFRAVTLSFLLFLLCSPVATGLTLLTVGLADNGQSAVLMGHKEMSFRELDNKMRELAKIDSDQHIYVTVKEKDSAGKILQLVHILKSAGLRHVNFVYYDKENQFLIRTEVKDSDKRRTENFEIEEILEEIPTDEPDQKPRSNQVK